MAQYLKMYSHSSSLMLISMVGSKCVIVEYIVLDKIQKNHVRGMSWKLLLQAYETEVLDFSFVLAVVSISLIVTGRWS